MVQALQALLGILQARCKFGFFQHPFLVSVNQASDRFAEILNLFLQMLSLEGRFGTFGALLAAFVLISDLGGIAKQFTDILPNSGVQIADRYLRIIADRCAAKTWSIAADAAVVGIFDNAAIRQSITAAKPIERIATVGTDQQALQKPASASFGAAITHAVFFQLLGDGRKEFRLTSAGTAMVIPGVSAA